LMGMAGLIAITCGVDAGTAPRFGIVSVALLFISGGLILRKVKAE